LLHPPKDGGAKNADFKAQLRSHAPDVIVVASFGELLDAEFLDLALVLNVHGSLLPRHRGASPVQAALLAGDTETGVTIQRVVLALDAGDVLHQKACAIQPDDTAGALFERLAQLGAEALPEALDKIAAGTATYTPQDPEQVTVCRKLKKDAGKIDWSRPALELERLVRAMSPWPSALTQLPDGRALKVHRAHWLESPLKAPPPGTLIETSPRLVVATSACALQLLEVQVAGKRAMPVPDFLRGNSLQVGDRLGAQPN
jgi:methionyl-tRNA formyltransferase